MKASVVSDKSTRTIEIQVEGLPTLDVTETWHRKTRMILPDKAIVRIVDGEPRSIVVLGPLLKQGGQPSEHVRNSRSFTPKAYISRERIETAPGWVRELFAQVPLGVTAFTWVSPEEAQVL